MKTYELNQTEINLIIKALRYATEYGYENTQCQEEVDEYADMRVLIHRLDPKPVKKHGWMNVYSGKCASAVHETREDADKCASARRVKCIEVHWEE